MQWLQYSSELLTFSGTWINISQPIRDAYVIGPHLLFEAIKLGDESIHLLRIVLFLSFFYLFVEQASPQGHAPFRCGRGKSGLLGLSA